jgi:hypothetical protein
MYISCKTRIFPCKTRKKELIMEKSKKEKEQPKQDVQVVGVANRDNGAYIEVGGVVVLVKFEVIR